MKIIEKKFNLIPNCKKFKLGGKYDDANIYQAMGFNDTIANLEIELLIEEKTYILQIFLIIKGFLKIEVFDTKYTRRKCKELEIDVDTFEEIINNQKAKHKEAKLFTKFEHKECLELLNCAYFDTITFLKKINKRNKQEVLKINEKKLSKYNFNSIEEFFEFYSDENAIKELIKVIR